MSSSLADRYRDVSPEESGEPAAPSLSDRYRNQAQDLDRDPLTAATRDRRYQDLLYNLALGNLANENPELGDPALYVDRAAQLLEELATAWGVAQTPLATRATDDLPEFMASEGMPRLTNRVARVGANTLGTIASAFQPLQLPGDFVRTYWANLAEVQRQRDERNLGFEPSDINPQEGTARGSPASNPIQAFDEMFRAAQLTSEQLELGGGQGFRGWYVYAPDLEWQGRRIWGISPYEEDKAVRGSDLVRRYGLDARFGIETDVGREWLGLATEMILDPLNFADVLFAGARVASTIAKRTGNTALLNNARRMEQSAGAVYAAITPRGVAQNVAAGINLASRAATGTNVGVMDIAFGAINRGINTFLDMPMGRNMEWVFPAATRSNRTQGIFGLGQESLMPKWRDFFGQEGTFAWLHGPRPSWLTGSEDIGLSAGEVAMGMRSEIQKIGTRGMIEMGEAIVEGLPTTRFTLRMPWVRVAIPGARRVDPDYFGYVRGLNSAISDWLDTAPINVNVKSDPKMMQRLRDLSEVYNLPVSDTLQRFNGAVTAGRRVILQVGYETSGYRVFTEAMRRAADDLGVNYNDMRRAYEEIMAGVDLQTLEVGDFFHFVKPGETGATLPTSESRRRVAEITDAYGRPDVYENPPPQVQQFEEWVEATNRHLELMGASELRGITPDQFLEGTLGYLRRLFQGVQDPQAAVKRLLKNDVIVLQEVHALDTAELLGETFGQRAGDEALRYLMSITPSTPRGRIPGEDPLAMHFQTEDLARVISRYTDQPVSASDVARVIYSHDPNASYAAETIEILRGYNAGDLQPVYGTGGTPYTQAPARFQGREDMDPEYLARLLQETDPLARVASVAAVGGRQVGAQEFLGMVWANLNEDGLVIPTSQLDAIDLARMRAGENLTPMSVDGVPYVIIPENPQVWGPLAGNAIPEDIARSMVRTLSTPNVSQSGYERMLSMWRQMLISPLPTSLRNVIGNFLLIQQAGGNLTDMFQALPRAIRLRSYYLETGRLPEEFRGYEHLFNFIRDESTMVAAANRSMEEVLLGVAEGRTPVAQVLNASLDMGSPGEFVQWLTEGKTAGGTAARVLASAGGTGALGLFRYGEEVSRLTAFLTVYDSLMRAGKTADEAINRAAHFAVNSAYNYAALPGLPSVLRRSGLSAFPQFAYFTVGRTPRVIAENPMAPLRFEYLRRGINLTMTEGDMREQERITRVIEDFQRYSTPLAFPVRGKDGKWRVFDMQYFFPQGASPVELLADPFTLPFFAPALDAFWAWGRDNEEGTGIFSSAYGRNVFSPSSTTGERAGQTAQFLAGEYLFPGVWRSYERGLESYAYVTNRPRMDMWAMATMRNVNTEPVQIAARLFGVNLRNVGTRPIDARYQQELNEIQRRFDVQTDDALRRYTAAVAEGRDPDQIRSLQARYQELQRERIAALNEFLRVMGGN